MFARLRWLLGAIAMVFGLAACAQQPQPSLPLIPTATPRQGAMTPGIVLPPTWTLAPTQPPTLTATLRPTRTPSSSPTPTPAATLSPTRPTPTLSPDLLASLRIVYTWNDHLYLWHDWVTTTISITAGVESPRLSDDGRWVAFVREQALWAVSLDDSRERLLVSAEDFASLPPVEPGVGLYDFDWLPGGHILLFNTRLQADDLQLTDDLYRVEVETGEWGAIALPGEGGECYPSPDKQRLACVTSDEIAVMNSDGSGRQILLRYEPVYISRGFEYYPMPRWASDSQSLYVAIPHKDPLAIPPLPTVVWRLTMDGAAPLEIVRLSVEKGWLSLSPDLTRLAYEQVDESGIRTQLHLATLDLQEDVVYAIGQVGFFNWAPDSRHFAFWRGDWSNVWVGEWGGTALPVGDRWLIDFRWLDETSLLYSLRSYAGKELYLAILGEPGVRLLKGVEDYDFVR